MRGIKNNILYGGPDPDVTDGEKSFGELILNRLNHHQDEVALIDGVTSEEMTYTQLRDRSLHYASAMMDQGLKEGDVIGICSENRLEYPCVLYGAFYLGLTVAPLNLTYSESELNHALNLSKPKIIFSSPYVIDKVATVAKKNGFIKKVVVFGEENPSISGVECSQAYLKNSRIASNFKPKPLNIKDNVALVLCSSGTTGLPKGVQLTQYNILVAVAHIGLGIFTLSSPRKEMTILGIIPWFHAFGCLTLCGTTLNGIKIVLLPKFEEYLFLSAIENYKITQMFLVPPLMVFLAKHPLVDNYDMSTVEEIICGAAPLSKEIEDAVSKRIGVLVKQGYGMSEMTLSTLLQTDVRKPGSVGNLRPGMYGKVIDPETKKILGPNQPGELCFKGSQNMKGYIGNDAATRDTIDSEGWLHTGDIGYFDEDEQYFIVDRLKELIKYKGYQVPPAEIEALLLTHVKIRDAAVVGVPDEAAGELPFAFVVKQPGMDLTEREVIDFVAKKASPAKRLHGGVRFVEEIPKNPSGKILRRELRALLKQTLKAKL
ncbi:luciferin 4-monooxygenase [Sergentomyia squamirostris]